MILGKEQMLHLVVKIFEMLSCVKDCESTVIYVIAHTYTQVHIK